MTTTIRIAIPLSLVAACSAAPSASQAPRQDELFDPDTVQRIALEISAADLAALEAQVASDGEFEYVPATFTWNDVTLENVGVRYKGNSSRVPATYKRSFLIKFDEFVEDQELFGLERLALDNGIQFGSLFSERLLNEILDTEGVPVPRATYATLSINGIGKGVYVELERIDKAFLARHFDDNDGNLYKCDEGGVGCRLAYLGADPALYVGGERPSFQIETNGDTADGRDLVELAQTLQNGSVDEVLAAVDVDAMIAVMPVMMLGGAFDQYTGFQAHNYYLYRDPTTSRWSYLTHDLDVGFADNAFGMIPVIDGWNAANPRPVTPLPLVERVLDDATLAARYRERARDDLDRYFEPGVLGARLDALYAQIEADLAADPFPHARLTSGGADTTGYPGIIADLKTFMRVRYDAARSQLAEAP